MTGEEVRTTLQQHQVSLAWLAKQLDITPQCLNARLNAQIFKPAYQREITDILKKDIFGINAKAIIQPIIDLYANDDAKKIFSTENTNISEYVSIPAFVGCVGIIYHGNDASPKYEKGDVIFVSPQDGEIISGRKYLIFTKKERLVRIAYKEEDNNIRLIAINTAVDDKGRKIHNDIVIKNTDVVCACKIVGSISREFT